MLFILILVICFFIYILGMSYYKEIQFNRYVKTRFTFDIVKKYNQKLKMIESITNMSIIDNFKKITYSIGGTRVFIIIFLICFTLSAALYTLTMKYTIMNPSYIFIASFSITIYVLLSRAKIKQKLSFEKDIPAGLNTLVAQISCGKSFEVAYEIMVMALPEGKLKNELNTIVKKLNINADGGYEFFQIESLKSHPYRAYVLFSVITTSCYGGGSSFKDSLNRVSEVIYEDFRILQKKKILTGEARGSITVLAGLPFIIFAILSFVNKQVFVYTLNDPTGIYVFYYLLISEFLGLVICIFLYKRASV